MFMYIINFYLKAILQVFYNLLIFNLNTFFLNPYYLKIPYFISILLIIFNSVILIN